MGLVARRRGLIGFLVAALAVTWTSPGLAVPTEFILNGEFGTNAAPSLASWTLIDTANARSSGDTINGSSGNAGFNSYFTSAAFAVLGDTSGDIGGGPTKDTHSISQGFVLPALVDGVPVLDWALTVNFITAFDGKHKNTADTFAATLTGPAGAPGTLFSQNSSGFPECGPGTGCANNQLDQIFIQTFPDLAPGTYTLKFELVEAFNIDTNTAAGIDKVSITGEATLAAVVPEPTSLLLWGLTAVGLGLILRRTTRRP